ncbi:MAG: hypothetical protein A2060_06230 [Planctomycetes bacterium GWA2_50_13]|nr:MAG: hypothetical protein A2060_06230 [Planctomycetes bacterium GWA2_50_13]OHB95281.1 MAG: hypothetical protein A3I59_05505 [Planctomycetes bacterium RIFCSPLOWO2_02_FULL_50_16]OHC03478.1 MAG: hypothetical protein A3G17_03295 [Planctomycetes bacterium RIFCSPLOWO2_12_FULL_50_35]HCN19194.1 hypothetical protein [Planctomycetia bacterium]
MKGIDLFIYAGIPHVKGVVAAVCSGIHTVEGLVALAVHRVLIHCMSRDRYSASTVNPFLDLS